MKIKLFAVILILLSIKNPIWSARSGFSANQIIFQDGSGWKEATTNVCGTSVQVLQAVGTAILSNGVVLDTTIGTVRNFIDTSVIGMIMPFASSQVPPGWLPCAGQIITVSSVSNCDYQQLADKIQTTWGPAATPGAMVNGKFVGRFQLPDLRGQFLRGALTGGNQQGITADTNRESPSDSNYTRYTAPDFATQAPNAPPYRVSLIYYTVGTYQPSGFTTHSTEHNFTINPNSTTTVGESHSHSYTQITLTQGYRFYYPNPLADGTIQGYDYPDDNSSLFSSNDGTEDNYHGTSPALSGNTESGTETHSHGLAPNITQAESVSTPESYPQNAAVTFGIRY